MSWSDWILAHETGLRLGFFGGVLLLMGLWELARPRRALRFSRKLRWSHNLALVFLNSLAARVLLPTTAVGVALYARDSGWGLFNAVNVPAPLAVLFSVILLDFVIWLQHVMVHAIPVLWRLHRVHHADLDYDATTGARFHTLEILLSLLIKFATILLLGPPLVAVVLFEILLNATAMFNHSNIELPAGVDQVLRWFLVTPDMHRVHHSVEDDETNSNFGFNLPWWDRLLGTYREAPRAGYQQMVFGIHGYTEPKQTQQLPGMLALPFSGPTGDYAINRRSWPKQDNQGSL